MNYQKKKFKEQMEQGIDPLNEPQYRYGFRFKRKRLKSQIKVVITLWKLNQSVTKWLTNPFRHDEPTKPKS